MINELKELHIKCGLGNGQDVPKEIISESMFNKGKLVAYAGIVKSHNLIPTLTLMVAKNFRKRGIATKLMRELLQRWKLPLFLTVANDNSIAIKIYKNFGFIKICQWRKIRNKPHILMLRF